MVVGNIKPSTAEGVSEASSQGPMPKFDLSHREARAENAPSTPSTLKYMDGNEHMSEKALNLQRKDLCRKLQNSPVAPVSLPFKANPESYKNLVENTHGLRSDQCELSSQIFLTDAHHTTTEEPMRPSIFTYCDVEKTFLDRFAGREDVEEKTSLLAKKTKGLPFKPLLGRKDYLLRYPTETQRLEEPSTIPQASSVMEHPAFGLFPNSSQLRKPYCKQFPTFP